MAEYKRTNTQYKKNTVNKKVAEKQDFEKKSPEKKGLEKDAPAKKRVRKSDLCPVFGKCGGCQLINMPYEEQLRKKQKLVENAIASFGKVDNIIGMEKPQHYRNKVNATFDHDKFGNAISGIYEEKSHRVVPMDSCMLDDEKADEIIVSIRGLLKSFKIKTYDEDTGYGLIRHVMVRVGKNSGQIMVVLVLSTPILPGKSNFVKALRKLHPEITTIVINVNGRNTSMVLSEKEQIIYGPGFIEDTLCGKTFKISPKSFYQVNPAQTEILYQKAIDLAGLTGKEVIMDAYSGIGTIGIIASDKAARVISVELNRDAVRDAVSNAKKNEINNIEIYNKDAGQFMTQLAEQKVKMDVVFMDPPRTGSDETFLNCLCELSPEKVVYISCNPMSLGRDLKYLKGRGYKMKKAIPVDQFPFNGHVETIVLMSRDM